MTLFPLTKKQRLILTIVISASFFATELIVGFMTRSLALIADAVHYLNDIISFIVALVALIISERNDSPEALSFGWQRAQLLGSFFNGVFLIALGIGIVFSSIERFIEIQHVQKPFLVLVVACVGLTLNIITLLFLHDHDHGHGDNDHNHGASDASEHQHIHTHDERGGESSSLTNQHHLEHRHNTIQPSKPARDLGMLAVIIHVIGDAINNLGVILVALVIWKTSSPSRYYADPAISLFIAVMLIVTAIPVSKRTGHILLESAPIGLAFEDIKHDLERVPGVESVHELHVWRLNQQKTLASAHVRVADPTVADFVKKAKVISECLHAYGIHSITLQPELTSDGTPSFQGSAIGDSDLTADGLRRRGTSTACQISCTSRACEKFTCCP